MLTWIIVGKALAEIAGLALIGRGVLHLLAGAGRERNMFYRVLTVMTAPVLRVTRWITPRFVPDGQIGVAAFFLVAGLWLALTLLKIKLVLAAVGR